jgi:hypothetical protein
MYMHTQLTQRNKGVEGPYLGPRQPLLDDLGRLDKVDGIGIVLLWRPQCA